MYPVDIIVCMDVTGSMQNEIDAVKDEITNIVERIRTAENAHLRFGYVAYRDHKPQESTFVTKSHGFTSNIKKMKEYIGLYNASGGGDGPEAMAAGMKACLDENVFNYRDKAVKMVILITDAPPHVCILYLCLICLLYIMVYKTGDFVVVMGYQMVIQRVMI